MMMFGASFIRFTCSDPKLLMGDGFYLAFTFYLFVFGILLTAAEYEIVFILKYMEIMFSDAGKGSFLMFIGILLFDEKKVVEFWAGIYLVLVGVLNLIAACVK